MIDGGNVSAGVNHGPGRALREPGQLDLKGREGLVRVRLSEELDAAPALDPVHEVAPDHSADSDGEGSVDTSLRDPGLELGDRQRGVLAPREVEESLLRHQLVERRLAAGELGRRLAVAGPRVLALVAAAGGAALRGALATTETGVLLLA